MAYLYEMNETMVDKLCLGAAMLGSGGGGEPLIEQQVLENLFRTTKKTVKVIDVSMLANDALILPVCYMGAPSVMQENLPCLNGFLDIIRLTEEKYSKVAAISAGEIGGANALIPLIVSLVTDLPVVDGDLVGRAFPELSMSSANIGKDPLLPTAIIAGMKGECEVITTKDAFMLEETCRNICIDNGSASALGLYPMSAKVFEKKAILGSMSHAIQIGGLLSEKKLPTDGELICSGYIRSIKSEISDGFLIGQIEVQSGKKIYSISLQNEYMALNHNKSIIAQAPEIISLIDAETYSPISSESVYFGQEVVLYVLPAPKIWKSKDALKLLNLDHKESDL
ncbi:MAG: hypothetical protein CMF48_02755 [Legionellales bacterium]|nr:hypothetical protein [Legionellales bacterium]